MKKPRVMVLGKLPPPHIGPAVATAILLHSNLKDEFDLVHFDTKLNDNVADMGAFKWSKIGAVRALHRRFREALRREGPGLVLVPIGQTTAGFFKDAPLIAAAANAGARVVLHLRGSDFRRWYDSLDGLRRNYVKRTLTRAHGVIVLGDNLRYLFKGLLPEEAIHVVPNGGDYAFPARANFRPRITYLANYLPGKGLKELLQALLELQNRPGLPEWEFRSFGSWDDASYRAECEALACQVKHQCILGGPVSGTEKWQALADTDVFVFAPKAPEGHPWSVVEAIAAGLPVLATDRGAIRQSVIDERNGYLLSDPHPREMADRLETLLKNIDLRRDMGRESRNLYLEGFTADHMVKNMGETFNKVLQGSCAAL